MRRRMTAGLPATIYRPSIVVGDSQTGETQKFDGPYFIMQLVPVPRRLAKLGIRSVPGAYRLLRIPAEAVDYFAHPTHYLTDHMQADLAGSGIEVPRFPDYVDRLVGFMREHHEIGSAAMV